MASLDTRLRQYAVLGARQGVIPDLTFAVTSPLGDAASVTFTVAEAVSGALPALVETALEVLTPSGWVEPRGCRFLAATGSGDRLSPAGVESFSGTNLVMWLLRSLQIEPGGAELVDGARRFNSATPGAILKTFIDEGQSRGWGPGVTYDFTASVDSAGVAWASEVSLGYRPGQVNALTALQNLYDQGLVDFHTEGRTLRVFNAGTGVDRSGGGAPVRLGKLTSLPVRASLDSLVTDVTLYGDDGFTLQLNNPAAMSTLGRLEKAIAQGGVSDEGTATLLAQRTLDQGAQVRREISATTTVADADWLPFVDYQVGDWVGAKLDTWESLRVYELVVSRSDTTTISTVLNDRYLDLMERLAKRTTGILGGAVTGGTGGMPGDDLRKPKPPVGLVGTSLGYWAGTVAQSQVSLTWTPVTQGENSVAIDVTEYELWGAPGDAELNAITTTTTAAVTWSPFDPGAPWRFAVKAQSRNGVWGDLSAEVEVSMASPVEQLLAPSAPVVITEHGVIDVAWDGLFAGGSLAPVSYMQMNIETSLNTSTGFKLVGTLREVGEHRIVPATDGDALYVRFVAVDVLGRKSTPSPSTPITVSQFIPSGYITAQMLAAGVGGHLDITANEAVTIIVGQIAAAMAGVDANTSDIEDLRTYFDFQPDGLYISMPGSAARLRLANDRIEMLNGAEIIGYWEGGVFVASSIVTAVAQIGNHVLSGELAGHTIWRPV